MVNYAKKTMVKKPGEAWEKYHGMVKIPCYVKNTMVINHSELW